MLPRILLVDSNTISQRIIKKQLHEVALIEVATVQSQIAESLGVTRPDRIIINADSIGSETAALCAWLDSDPHLSQIDLTILTSDTCAKVELTHYEAGASNVVHLPCSGALLQYKILKQTRREYLDQSAYHASNTLNRFYENTYTSTSLSYCMTECLKALEDMGLQAALHVCDHPELTCSSFGSINSYEKALLSYAECLKPSPHSARLTFGDERLSILVQNLPNEHHPEYKGLIDWVKKIFNATSQKAKELLAKHANKVKLERSEHDNIPHTLKGAQRLHYHVERAIHMMEASCEADITLSIDELDQAREWPLSAKQMQHLSHLRSRLMELKEALLTNCLEIESRYLQFITERRAKTRLNLGW